MIEPAVPDYVYATLAALSGMMQDVPHLMPEDGRKLAFALANKWEPLLEGDQAMADAIIRLARAAMQEPK